MNSSWVIIGSAVFCLQLIALILLFGGPSSEEDEQDNRAFGASRAVAQDEAAD